MKSTSQEKEPTVNFRVSEDLKLAIIQKAGEKRQTVSAYLREVLEDVHLGSYCQKELNLYHEFEFAYSPEFIGLVMWLYRKRYVQDFEESDLEIKRYIKILKSIDDQLPESLQVEFDKVLLELMELIREDKDHKHYTYRFPGSSIKEWKFDYSLLENYFRNKIKSL
ncbi:hypothetical protein [Mangrovimonas sp. ST2L15]|uniref:hypothetical protein n=1 Tax=Mangrovimonas sp. ST2L15 TaxID=1645916 RepID=UPI0006B40BEA|nr:hypothetical protein [Mangrovimonas sp. ST2L15]